MTRLSIPDMTCGHCKAAVETALAPVAAKLVIDLTTHVAQIESDHATADLIARLGQIGYAAHELPG